MGLDEALKPIRDPEAATPEEFAERAGRVLSELNYVHPLREGNGRAQEVFVSELGRHYGHEIVFSVITKPRMIEAPIETTNNPSSLVMKQVIEDAMHPGRREAIDPHSKTCERSAKASATPSSHRPPGRGDHRNGSRPDDRIASFVTDHGIVVADRADLPERLPDDEEITFTARSDFSRVRREQPVQQAQSQQPAPARQPQQDHNPELKAIEAQMAAQGSSERDDDDRER